MPNDPIKFNQTPSPQLPLQNESQLNQQQGVRRDGHEYTNKKSSLAKRINDNVKRIFQEFKQSLTPSSLKEWASGVKEDFENFQDLTEKKWTKVKQSIQDHFSPATQTSEKENKILSLFKKIFSHIPTLKISPQQEPAHGEKSEVHHKSVQFKEPLASNQSLEKLTHQAENLQKNHALRRGSLNLPSGLEKKTFKDLLESASEMIKKNPIESLELLNKLKLMNWGAKIFKYDISLRRNYNKIYEEAVKTSVEQISSRYVQQISQITEEELLKNSKYERDPVSHAEHCPHLSKIAHLYNQVNESLSEKILSKTDINERTKMIETCINIAYLAYKQGDLFTSNAIYTGLQTAHIRRLLVKSSELLSQNTQVKLKVFDDLWGEAQSTKIEDVLKYNLTHPERPAIPPLTPFLGPILYSQEKLALEDEKAKARGQEELNGLLSNFSLIQQALEKHPLKSKNVDVNAVSWNEFRMSKTDLIDLLVNRFNTHPEAFKEIISKLSQPDEYSTSPAELKNALASKKKEDLLYYLSLVIEPR